MCVSPISIPNPNYGKKPKPGTPFALKDCTSKMISIPCGHCDECIAVKQMYLVQRVQMESLVNHVFFCTITYNDEMMPWLETSSGVRLRYCDYKDITNMIKRIRKDDAFGVPFRFLCVTERGSKRARPHAHILFFIKKSNLSDNHFLRVMYLERLMFDVVLKYWSRNVGTNRKPVYKPCCTYIRKFIRGKLKTTYDLHAVLPRDGDDTCTNVAFYVLKYMLKGSNHDVRLQQALKLNYSDDEYKQIWKIVRSRCCASKGFGLSPDEYVSRKGISDPDPSIVEYLRNGIKSSASDPDAKFPYFFNIDSGNTFPLAPYYKRRGIIYRFVDALSFYYKDNSDNIDSPVIPSEDSVKHQSDVLGYISRSTAIHDLAEQLCDADCLDELFE